MRQWKNGVLACLLAVAALAAGCGSSDNKSDTSGGGGGGASGGGGNTPTSVDEAVKQCLKQAKSVKDKDAAKTALEACKAAKSGDTSKVKDAAKQECLKVVEQIPDSAKSQKDEAKKRCEAIK
jgi:hypothetical protein